MLVMQLPLALIQLCHQGFAFLLMDGSTPVVMMYDPYFEASLAGHN